MHGADFLDDPGDESDLLYDPFDESAPAQSSPSPSPSAHPTQDSSLLTPVSIAEIQQTCSMIRQTHHCHCRLTKSQLFAGPALFPIPHILLS